MTTDPHHEHLDLELAADFDERLLDAAASADVAARIAACATCAEALDSIHRTRATLSALPGLPMPAAVADRLHAALAEETLSASVPGGATTVTALAGRRASRFWLPALVGVAAAGAIVFVVVHRGTPTHSTAAPAAMAATSAAASAAQGVPTTMSGIDYATAARDTLQEGLSATNYSSKRDATAAGSAAVASASDTLGVDSADSASPAMPVAPTPQAPSGSTTAAASSAPTASAPAASSTDSGTTIVGSAAAALDMTVYTPLRDPATLDACVARLVDPETGVRPTLIDYAAFNGQPAVAIYFPSAVAGESEVYVVGVQCGPVKDDMLDFLLHVPTPTP